MLTCMLCLLHACLQFWRNDVDMLAEQVRLRKSRRGAGAGDRRPHAERALGMAGPRYHYPSRIRKKRFPSYKIRSGTSGPDLWGIARGTNRASFSCCAKAGRLVTPRTPRHAVVGAGSAGAGRASGGRAPGGGWGAGRRPARGARRLAAQRGPVQRGGRGARGRAGDGRRQGRARRARGPCAA